MSRMFLAPAAALALALAACSSPEPTVGPDGQPLPQVYKISKKDRAEIPTRVLEQLNALRAARGAPPVALSPELTAAANGHSSDMARQNRAWHFGTDGSSPFDRARRAGYSGAVLGEDISETYETESETLSAWMANESSRNVLLAPAATDIGLAWYQEGTGKIWWTLVTGSRGGAAAPSAAQGYQQPYAAAQPAYPQAAYPQTAYPQTTYPQTAYPQTAYPQAAYPQAAYPQTAYPQTAYPQTAYPQAAQPAAPAQGYYQPVTQQTIYQ